MVNPVAEAPLWIAVNGERRIVLSCSPHEPAPLALGHLVAEGWVERVDDVRAWRTVAGGVEVELDAARVAAIEALQRHRLAHGCGLRHYLDCDVDALPRIPPTDAPPDPAPLLRDLFRLVPAGGVHAAAYCAGAALAHVTADVARHCAVDRVIGMAALAGGTGGGGLVMTARVSGAIALKAAHSRIGWIASRSIATTLAHELCAAAGIALYERAGRGA